MPLCENEGIYVRDTQSGAVRTWLLCREEHYRRLFAVVPFKNVF